ncbi:hypothetical protein [Nocardia sp. NPDC005978]|uniref:hypothetical protein n=1 Tax=unclassified Nocardia TaxID=2637762 RepID=UPI0033A9334F
MVATGVVVVRAERRRRAYTPDQVRDQLHARFAEAAVAEAAIESDLPATEPEGGWRERVRAVFRRGRFRRGSEL